MAITTPTQHLEPGSAAPGFDGTDEQGKRHRLGEYRGQTLVLCFLPHDTGRPGRDRREQYPGSALKDVFMLGVMLGTPQKIGEWKRRSKADFPILADAHGEICRLYGMLDLMAREHHPGFVAIGPDGRVRVVLKHPSKPGHVFELLRRAEKE
jgi:peroxiredoxin Q/BCP